MDYIIIPIAIRVTGIKVDAKHSRRFLYSSAPLFIYLCSSFLHPHVYTCTYTPALMYAPVDFTYQRPVRSRNVARPETRSFELGFSQLYTRHCSSLSVPFSLPVSHLISLVFSFVSFAHADPHNRQNRRREGVYKLRA